MNFKAALQHVRALNAQHDAKKYNEDLRLIKHELRTRLFELVNIGAIEDRAYLIAYDVVERISNFED